MQGISASLQHPNQQCTASSSSTPGPHDSCHPSSVPLPSQLESGVHAVQQASRAGSGSALSPAESVQPRVFTGVVVGHSSAWQDHPEVPPSSQGGVGLQVGVTQSVQACRLMSVSWAALHLQNSTTNCSVHVTARPHFCHFPLYYPCAQNISSRRSAQYHAAVYKLQTENGYLVLQMIIVCGLADTRQPCSCCITQYSGQHKQQQIPYPFL